MPDLQQLTREPLNKKNDVVVTNFFLIIYLGTYKSIVSETCPRKRHVSSL